MRHHTEYRAEESPGDADKRKTLDYHSAYLSVVYIELGNLRVKYDGCDAEA